MRKYELSIGFYAGILFGMRTYEYADATEYVFYLPFLDFSFYAYHN
jgi:hypothetical protein